MSIILYAIPGFFLLIAAELIAEKVRQTNYYRVNDAITSLSIGVMSRVVGVLKNLVPLTFYFLIYEHFAFFSLPNSWPVWLLAFVAYDFLYYWNHRCGHEISLFWAAHVVHHSSEDYNLSTALRQSSGSIFNFVFFLPLALVGVEPLLFIAVGSVNLVYQFWVHTQHVKKIGIFEWVLVTPSNHRVHHAQNQIYLDKNYGGVFIIWDRLFGTYQDELDEEKPIYGVRKALNSFNPFYANVQVYSQLFKDSWRTKHWRDKLRVWFGRTGWRPHDMETHYPLHKSSLKNFKAYDHPISSARKIYCIFQYALMAAIGVFLMLNANGMPVMWQLIIAGFLIISSVNVAWIMENRPIATTIEYCRAFALLLGIYFYLVPV